MNMNQILAEAGISHTPIEKLKIGKEAYFVELSDWCFVVKSAILLGVQIGRYSGETVEYKFQTNSHYGRDSYTKSDIWVTSDSMDLAELVAMKLTAVDLKQKIIADCHRLKQLKKKRDELKETKLIEALAELS